MTSKGKDYVLKVEKRDTAGTRESRRLRRAGRMPAVVYGHGAKPISISFSTLDLHDLERSQAGIIKLAVAGRKQPLNAILKEIQRDPITGKVLHLDFQVVRMDEIITATARIEPFGEPAGHQAGGELEQLLHEIEIRCLPADMVDEIRVDVSGMELDDVLRVGDIQFPEGITPVPEPDIAVFQVRQPRVMEEAAVQAEEGGEEAEEGEGEKPGEKSEAGEA